MKPEPRLRELLKKSGITLSAFQIAEGGSAVVHRGQLTEANDGIALPPGSDIAIKEYKDEIFVKQEQLDRIYLEEQVGKLVQHPNIVKIHALVRDDDASPLLIMDWVSGTSLDRWLQNGNKARTWEEIQRVSLGLVEGLAALHEQKIRHRDIKPTNILVSSAGEPILMDMGVVELASNDENTLHTKVKDFIGSVRYAAPQFIRGEEFDYADDIYALGATLFLMVTGKEVFSEIERRPLLPHFILTKRLSVGEISSGLPSQLSVLLEGALHPERKRRPSLEDVRGFLKSPETALYIQRELNARNREKRGFAVIATLDQGATVLADLRGDKPIDTRYIVVREMPAVRVPSLGGDAQPEKWIADVQLKHLHNSIGHFSVIGKRWVQGSPSGVMRMTEALAGTPGHWVEYDKQTEVVRVGDVIVELVE